MAVGNLLQTKLPGLEVGIQLLKALLFLNHAVHKCGYATWTNLPSKTSIKVAGRNNLGATLSEAIHVIDCLG